MMLKGKAWRSLFYILTLVLHCRAILLKEGVEKLIRKAKAIHGNCKSAATDALRDLGLDNYNV
jgi:hypothetical protein